MNYSLSIPLGAGVALHPAISTVAVIILVMVSVLVVIIGTVREKRAITIESKYRLAKDGLKGHRWLAIAYGATCIISLFLFDFPAAIFALVFSCCHAFCIWKIRNGGVHFLGIDRKRR